MNEPSRGPDRTPARIGTNRHVVAMVASDTIDLLADRVSNLLAPGRRITLVRRQLQHVDSVPDVVAGYTPWGPAKIFRSSGAVTMDVRMKQDVAAGFGFTTFRCDDTEEEVWELHHSGQHWPRTWVTISGGLNGDGPALDDQIVIRRYTSFGGCEETVVAFDYGRDLDSGED